MQGAASTAASATAKGDGHQCSCLRHALLAVNSVKFIALLCYRSRSLRLPAPSRLGSSDAIAEKEQQQEPVARRHADEQQQQIP
eukprot:5996436-Pleurochrysis_carterae.AAC.2